VEVCFAREPNGSDGCRRENLLHALQSLLLKDADNSAGRLAGLQPWRERMRKEILVCVIKI